MMTVGLDDSTYRWTAQVVFESWQTPA